MKGESTSRIDSRTPLDKENLGNADSSLGKETQLLASRSCSIARTPQNTSSVIATDSTDSDGDNEDHSLHSLSYSNLHPDHLDKSGYYCGLSDSFMQIDQSLQEKSSVSRVNYFSKASKLDIRLCAMSPVVGCAETVLADIWAGADVKHYHPAISLPKKRPLVRTSRMDYVRTVIEHAKLWAEEDNMRRAILELSLSSSRQAKVAILAGRVHSASVSKHRVPFLPVTNSTADENIRTAALSAADCAGSLLHEWSRRADARLAALYVRFPTIDGMIALKRALKQFDTEMLSYRKSVEVMFRTCGDYSCLHIAIDGRSCQRHLVPQYHKRRLFKHIKPYFHNTTELYDICVEFSIVISYLESIWISENADIPRVLVYVMQAMDTAAAQDSEDTWVRACVLLESLKLVIDGRAHGLNDDQAVIDVYLYIQYAEAKVEHAFCIKLLRAAYHNSYPQTWGEFKYHYDLNLKQWQLLHDYIVRAKKAESLSSSLTLSTDIMFSDTVAALSILREWEICVLLRISQDDLHCCSLVNNAVRDTTYPQLAEVIHRKTMHSLMVCYRKVSQSVCDQNDRQVDLTTDVPSESVVVFSDNDIRNLHTSLRENMFRIIESYWDLMRLNATHCARITRIAMSSAACSDGDKVSAATRAQYAYQVHANASAYICGFIEEINVIDHASASAEDNVAENSSLLSRYKSEKAMAAQISSTYSSIPREVIALSMYTDIRAARALCYQVHCKLDHLTRYPAYSTTPTEWHAILISAEEALIAMSSVVQRLRDPSSKVFKISPMHCTCCDQNDVYNADNCKCHILTIWILDLTRYLREYCGSVKGFLEGLSLQEKVWRYMELMKMWAQLECMCTSLSTNSKVAKGVNEAPICRLRELVHVEASIYANDVKMLMRQRKASSVIKLVGGMIALSVLLFS